MTSNFLEEFLGIQFFGEFLIDRWVISREQLLEALEYQMYRNLRFGDIAIKKEFLKPEQAEHINDTQRSTDMTFGELAVALGHLSEEQVREIATYQKNNNLYLGEVLLRLGFIDELTLKRELANYREHQKRYILDDIEIPADVPSADLLKVGVDMMAKMFRRLVGQALMYGSGHVLNPEDAPPSHGYFTTVAVPFKGSNNIRFLCSVSRDLAISIASSVLKADASDEPEEIIVDGVKEFCNIVCGNTVAKLAQNGIEVDIGPPETLPNVPDPDDDHLVVGFPVRLFTGGLDLRFLVQLSGD